MMVRYAKGPKDRRLKERVSLVGIEVGGWMGVRKPGSRRDWQLQMGRLAYAY